MDLPFSFPNELLYLLGAIILIVGIGYIYYTQKQQKKIDDYYAYLRDQCKTKNLPMIDVVDLSGNAESYVGEIEEDSDIRFMERRAGLQIRPKFLEKCTPIYKNGVREYTYHANMYYPINKTHMFVFAQRVEDFRRLYPQLNFIDDDLEISTLLDEDGEELKYDCSKIVQEYEQSDYILDEYGLPIPAMEVVYGEQLVDVDGELIFDEEGEPVYEEFEQQSTNENGDLEYKKNEHKIDESELFRLIKEAKIKLATTKVRPGFIDYRRALALFPVALDGLQVNRLIQLTQQKMDMRKIDNTEKYLKYFVVIAAIIVFPIAIALMLKWFFPNGL